MPSLLVQSCSATKNQVSKPTPAIEVYDGYFFRIIKKARREGEFRSDLDFCILSAEHGLLDPEDEITTYDRRMTAERAAELCGPVSNELQSRFENNDYETIILNLGDVYEMAVDGLSEDETVHVKSIDGDGIGFKGRQLKTLIRSDSLVEEAV